MSALLSALAEVRKVDFRSLGSGLTGWQAQGSGHVQSQLLAGNIMILTESGNSHLSGGQTLRFTNSYRLIIESDLKLRFEHLHHGPERPVHLFNLIQSQPAKWETDNLHVCGSDCYSCSYEIGPDGSVSASWRVAGKLKNEQVYFYYTRS